MSNTDSTNDAGSNATGGAAGDGNAAANGTTGTGEAAEGDGAAGDGNAGAQGDAAQGDGTAAAGDGNTGTQADAPAPIPASDPLKATSTSVAALDAGAGLVGADPAQGLSLGQIVTMVITLAAGAANLVAPGASLAGMTITQLANLAVGVAGAVPAAVEAFDQIKQAASSGLPPTQEQWDAWNAAADQAHADLQAAAAAVR